MEGELPFGGGQSSRSPICPCPIRIESEIATEGEKTDRRNRRSFQHVDLDSREDLRRVEKIGEVLARICIREISRVRKPRSKQQKNSPRI